MARNRGYRIIAQARRPAPGIDIAGDLSAAEGVQSLPLKLITHVIHCAAAVPAKSAEFDRDNALRATTLAASLADAKHMARIVNISSVSVYKKPTSGPYTIRESSPVIEENGPGDEYAKSKRAAEGAFELLRERSNADVIHLRPSSIYGHGMRLNSLLPVLVTKALRGEALKLHGANAYTQNFVHVSDVADLALTACLSEKTFGHVVNAFSNDTFAVHDLAELVRKTMGSTSEIIDETSDVPVGIPTFENEIARELIGEFRDLSTHLRDAL